VNVLKNKIKAISLFSGCGGLDIGSHMAGIPVNVCVELDSDSVETLKLNKQFKRSKIIMNDIAKVSSNTLKTQLKKSRKEKYILIGGPPCQPFSKAGYWIGNHARKKDKDSRNMIGQYLRVLGDLKPDGFLLENVESLLHPTNKHVVDNIIEVAKKLKYKCKLIKANSLDYGVPQKRKRIFVIGSKKEFRTEAPKKTHGDPRKCVLENLMPYEAVGKHIKKFDKKKYFEKEEITNKGTYGKDLKEVPPGKNYIALTAKKGYKNPKFIAGKRFWSFLLKLHPNMSSWTIAAQPGPWVGPFHWTSRRLRVPEIAAIQTFPEDYKFYGNRRSIQRQIGNAVPSLLAKAMIEYLKENI